MNFMEIIKKRRSIRSFSKEPVSKEDILTMIEAARYAPSAANKQPLKYIAVSDKEYCDKLFPLTKWAGYTAPMGVPTLETSPTSYIIILVDEDINKNGDNDGAYAGENIVLTAQFLGISSCILGALDRKEIKKLLNIEDNLRIHTVIALGYPNQTSSVYDSDEEIKYSLDENGNFRVPKRTTDSILKIY